MINKLKCLFSNFYIKSMGNVGFFNEADFQEMLTIERKRTERNGTPFLLVQIDITGFAAEKGPEKLIMKVIYALHDSTREIDIKGWYKKEKTIGVLFTTVPPENQPGILKKIRDHLYQYLSPYQVDLLDISCLHFPTDTHQLPIMKKERSAFYPKLSGKQNNRSSLALKRLMDIFGSLFALAVLSPVITGVALLVKLTSKGPILFRQTRLGLGEKEFTFLKFRSMAEGSSSDFHRDYVLGLIHGKAGQPQENKPVWRKLENDPRITPVGRFIRKTSLDELPQFFNVLKGDMSLVGPRPPIPYEFDKYDTWHMRRILETKPGLTGFWQVKGRSATTFDDMVRMDIHYSTHWSLWLDLKLLFLTPLAVLSTHGAR